MTQNSARRGQISVVPGQGKTPGPSHGSRWPDGRETGFLLAAGSVGHSLGPSDCSMTRNTRLGTQLCVSSSLAQAQTTSPEVLASPPRSNPGFLPPGIFIALLLRFDIR